MPRHLPNYNELSNSGALPPPEGVLIDLGEERKARGIGGGGMEFEELDGEMVEVLQTAEPEQDLDPDFDENLAESGRKWVVIDLTTYLFLTEL